MHMQHQRLMHDRVLLAFSRPSCGLSVLILRFIYAATLKCRLSVAQAQLHPLLQLHKNL